MKFTTIISVALATRASAAVTANQVVSNLDALSEMSTQTNTIAQSISVTNFFSTAPQLINGYRQIVQIASDDVNSMQSKRGIDKRQECANVADPQKCYEDLYEIIEDPSELYGRRRSIGSPAASASDHAKRQSTNYDEAQQEAICSAFRGFATAHQQLLATTIGKHGLLSLTPFSQPVAQVLRVDEGAVDTLAFSIMGTVPTCASTTTQNKNDLDRSLQQAVDEYSS